MKRITAIDILLGLVAVAVTVAIFAVPAHAISQPEQPVSTSPASSVNQTVNPSAKVDLSLMNSATGGGGGAGGLGGSASGGAGGSLKQGDSYALMSSGSAAPLPSGLCPKGESQYLQVLFGLFTWATSSTRTEMECLDKVLAMLRDTAPKPVVVNYVQPSPPEAPASAAAASATVDPVKCVAAAEPPKAAPKKPVKTAGKKQLAECKA